MKLTAAHYSSCSRASASAIRAPQRAWTPSAARSASEATRQQESTALTPSMVKAHALGKGSVYRAVWCRRACGSAVPGRICTLSVLASYRVRNWCLGEACARFIARAPTGPSRVLREVVVRSLETRLQLHATLLWVARRRALCCMWDGMGTGQGGPLALGTGIIRAHMRVVGWLQACLIRM